MAVNDEINLELIRILVLANTLKEHDPGYQHVDDSDRREPIAAMLVAIGRTVLTIQLVSLLDEGIQEFLAQHEPDNTIRKMGDRVAHLAAEDGFEYPDRVKALVKLRHTLAHERSAYATWDQYDSAFRTVHRALAVLGVVRPPVYGSPHEDEEQDER